MPVVDDKGWPASIAYARTSAADASKALVKARDAARKSGNSAIEQFSIALMFVCKNQSTMERDMEILRNKLDVVEALIRNLKLR